MVKDAMVLIHLSKISLLGKICDIFEVMIPELVYSETVEEGKKRKYPDAALIEEMIEEEKIRVKRVNKDEMVERAVNFNIQGGEAEAVALYWQENADLLATDDDNVRKKKDILDLKLIGTPALILRLYQEERIDKKKFKSSLERLRDIGWFSNSVIDKVLLEGGKNG